MNLPTNYYMTGTATSGITPAGDQAVSTNTGTGNGFTPTSNLTSTPLYWYTPAFSGMINSGTYTLTLWSNQPASPADVTVQIGYSNPDGTSFVSLGTSTADVSASGGGNHSTNFVYSGPVLSLTNKVFVIIISQPSGNQATIVYNDGTDFGSGLNTPTGQTFACPTWTPTPCGYTQQVETDGTNDLIDYVSSQSTAAPSGWQNLGFSTAGWTNAVVWTNPTGPGIASIPWVSWSTGGPGNGADYELARHSFTIPAGAINISGTLNLAVDDNSASYMNGTLIQQDANPSTYVTNQTVRTFTIPAGSIVAGSNVLAINNGDSVPTYMGYDFQLVIYYDLPCTPTPTITSTKTPTPTITLTATPTVTNTITNTFTQTFTSTFTNTFTNTFTFTNTNTPTLTDTLTFTNTTTNTSTPTATSTATNTFTNTVTSTPTATFTNTNTLINTATPTYTFTNTPTNTITDTATPTSTPTNTFTNTNTNTPTATFTNTNTLINTATPTYTFTNTATNTITDTPTTTNTPTNTAINTNTPSNTPTNTPTNIFTNTFTPTPTNTFTKTPTPTTTNTFTSTATSTNTTSPTFTNTFTATFTPTPKGQYTVKVNVYNSAGEVVKTILTQNFITPITNMSLSNNVITTLQGAGSTVDIFFSGTLIGSWDGTTNNGNPATNGTYRIQIDNISPSGAETSISQEVTVNRSISAITVEIFNEAGEMVRYLYNTQNNPTGSNLNDVTLSSPVLYTGQNNSGKPYQTQIIMNTSSGSVSVMWDGIGDGGTFVTPGQYEIEVHWNEGEGAATNIRKGLLVEAGAVSGTVLAKPNVLNSTNGRVTTFDATSILGAYTIKPTVYTIAGEKVAVIQGNGGTAQATWNADGIASGLYIVSVEVDDINGNNIHRQRLKVMVIR